MTHTQRLLIFLVLITVLSGCQKPPEQELAAVREALNAAESAEASAYSPEELQTAKDALAAVQTEVEAQNQKFAPLRNYDEAKKLIVEATTKAEAAKTAAVASKAEARAKAEEALAQTVSLLDEATSALQTLEECPKKPKGFEADLEVLKGRIEGLSAETGGIEEFLKSEQFDAATGAAGQLSDQIQTLLDDLLGAQEKLGC